MLGNSIRLQCLPFRNRRERRLLGKLQVVSSFKGGHGFRISLWNKTHGKRRNNTSIQTLWWKKSQTTTWDLKKNVYDGMINYLSPNARFLPSTDSPGGISLQLPPPHHRRRQIRKLPWQVYHLSFNKKSSKRCTFRKPTWQWKIPTSWWYNLSPLLKIFWKKNPCVILVFLGDVYTIKNIFKENCHKICRVKIQPPHPSLTVRGTRCQWRLPMRYSLVTSAIRKVQDITPLHNPWMSNDRH